MKDLKNSKWLLTGGTSGLGLQLATQLIEKGARVAVVARGEKRLFELARQLPIVPIHADVSRKEDIHRITAQAFAELGGVDVLVNNASSLGPVPLRLLNDTECEDFERALQTNVLGAFRLTKTILPSMILKGSGTVFNITSDAAVSAYPMWGAYGASKAALDHLSRIWAEELKDKGIRFVSVDPGDMDTPLHDLAVPDADKASLKSPKVSAAQLIELVEHGSSIHWERRSL